MDFAGDAGAFLLLDLLDVGGQLGQPGPRMAHFQLFQLALGDVGHDAFPAHRAMLDRMRGGAQVDPLDVLPRLDPDAAFPVPAPQRAGRGLHRFQVGLAVVAQNQVQEAFRLAVQFGGGQAQQCLATLAQIGEGRAAVAMQHELVHQAGRVGDDGVEARLHLFQVRRKGGCIAFRGGDCIHGDRINCLY